MYGIFLVYGTKCHWTHTKITIISLFLLLSYESNVNDSANNFGKIRIIEYKTTASFIEVVLFLSNSFIVFIFEASDKTWNIPNEIQLREKERWVCYVWPYPHCSDWIIGTDVKTTSYRSVIWSTIVKGFQLRRLSMKNAIECGGIFQISTICRHFQLQCYMSYIYNDIQVLYLRIRHQSKQNIDSKVF